MTVRKTSSSLSKFSFTIVCLSQKRRPAAGHMPDGSLSWVAQQFATPRSRTGLWGLAELLYTQAGIPGSSPRFGVPWPTSPDFMTLCPLTGFPTTSYSYGPPSPAHAAPFTKLPVSPGLSRPRASALSCTHDSDVLSCIRRTAHPAVQNAQYRVLGMRHIAGHSPIPREQPQSPQTAPDAPGRGD